MNRILSLEVRTISDGEIKLRSYNLQQAKDEGLDIEVIFGKDRKIYLHKDLNKAFILDSNKTYLGVYDKPYKLFKARFYPPRQVKPKDNRPKLF